LISFNTKTDIFNIVYNSNKVKRIVFNNTEVVKFPIWDQSVLKTYDAGLPTEYTIGSHVLDNSIKFEILNSDGTTFISDSVLVSSSGLFKDTTINFPIDSIDIIFSGNTIRVDGSLNSVTYDKQTGFSGNSEISGKYPQITTNNSTITFVFDNTSWAQQNLVS